MTLLGLGVYTLPEAARLIHAQAREVRRWLRGYRFQYRTADGQKVEGEASPLWETQYDSDAELNGQAIGFLDLLELRVVKSFVAGGVPLSVVRKCLENARSIYSTSHPFVQQQFRTDGQTIFLQALRAQGENEFLDLKSLQYAFKDVIRPSLHSGIEYKDGRASRWFPSKKAPKTIVLDPEVQFGKPILAHSAVPTRVLFEAVNADGGDKAAQMLVSRVYEVPLKEVQAAVQFERELLAA